MRIITRQKFRLGASGGRPQTGGPWPPLAPLRTPQLQESARNCSACPSRHIMVRAPRATRANAIDGARELDPTSRYSNESAAAAADTYGNGDVRR